MNIFFLIYVINKKTINLFKRNPNQKSNHHIQLDEFRLEIQRRDQEILAMAAKMKTLEEQHQVNPRVNHIFFYYRNSI